ARLVRATFVHPYDDEGATPPPGQFWCEAFPRVVESRCRRSPRLTPVTRGDNPNFLGPWGVPSPLVGKGNVLARSDGQIGVQVIDPRIARNKFQQLSPGVGGRSNRQEDTTSAGPHIAPTRPHAKHIAISVGGQPGHDLVSSAGLLHEGGGTLAGCLRSERPKKS